MWFKGDEMAFLITFTWKWKSWLEVLTVVEGSYWKETTRRITDIKSKDWN